MAFDDASMQNDYNIGIPGPISWWSWRPGIQPRNALLLGVPFTLLALLLTLLGLITLVAGIVDSRSSPLLVPGTVRQHNAGSKISSPQLTIALRGPRSIPDTVTLAVSTSTFQHVALNAPVIVSYSQHLHFAYALEYAGRYYTVPGTSVAGNPVGSVALLLLGLIMLPYPILLAHWGWQDLLIERYQREKLSGMEARVVDKRATVKTRAARPGFAGRGSRPWYGLALLPLDEHMMQHVSTFSVSEEVWARIKDGECVKVVYSPHLHYVYKVQLSKLV
jgi:hypothetical protein